MQEAATQGGTKVPPVPGQALVCPALCTKLSPQQLQAPLQKEVKLIRQGEGKEMSQA